jgi:hypothetical protein
MEHVLRPHTSPFPLPKIPIFAPDTEYDHGPFFGYLKRTGWTIEDIVNVNDSLKPRNEIHAVLQTWTYFGIIYEVTAVPIITREFSKVEDGAAILSTCSLPTILTEWMHRESKKSASEKRQHAEHMSECFVMVAEIYDTIYRRDPEFLDSNFHLSIQLLYEYMVRAATLAHEPNSPGESIPPVRYRDLLGVSKVVEQTMKSWCPSEIHQLSELFSVTEMVFASFLNRPGPDKTHWKCGSTKCLAYQVTDEEEYETKHVESDCACEFVHAASDVLANILLKPDGPVPLVSCSKPLRGMDGLLHVELESSKHNTGNVMYVAISHVWSDGLGNNKTNAIPLCQFQRIVSLVSALFQGQNVAFWLDTLCFPLEPKEAYDMALIRMRQSYEAAEKVLVFDRYLLEKDSLEMAPEEIAMRIACGPWNRRLWTLQEGMLARALAFQFRDTAVDLSTWLQQTQEEPATLHSLVFSNVWKNYASLRVFETDSSRKMNIIQAKKALTFRSTSQSDDEPLCLGNLLGVDPEIIVRAGSKSERMKLIYSAIPRHFTSMIFWNSPKLTDPGFGWAPASLMAEGCGRTRTCYENARWNAELGLVVNLPGVLFSRSYLMVPESFRLIVDGQIRLIVQWDARWYARSDLEMRRNIANPTNKRVLNFGILLNKPLRLEVDDSTDAAFFAQACEVVRTDHHGTHVLLVGRVRVYRLECLKQHPDNYCPPKETLLANVRASEPSLRKDGRVQHDLKVSRADKIWQQDNSEIGQGSYHKDSIWCVG